MGADISLESFQDKIYIYINLKNKIRMKKKENFHDIGRETIWTKYSFKSVVLYVSLVKNVWGVCLVYLCIKSSISIDVYFNVENAI